MELASRIAVQRLLKQYAIVPRKALGQNFLVSTRVRNALVDAADITPCDIVIEIGAGLGAITEALASLAKKVIAIERDEKLCAALNDLFSKTPNVEIICDDALRWLGTRQQALGRSYKTVGNIPYRITGPLLRALVDAENPPERIAFMVQKEVAERLAAKPPHMNLLALAAQHGAAVTRGPMAAKEAFLPKPKVASAIISFVPQAHEKGEDETLFRVAKAAFAHPRKQIAGTLARSFHKSREQTAVMLSRCGILPAQRPQELSPDQWRCLSQTMK